MSIKKVGKSVVFEELVLDSVDEYMDEYHIRNFSKTVNDLLRVGLKSKGKEVKNE